MASLELDHLISQAGDTQAWLMEIAYEATAFGERLALCANAVERFVGALEALREHIDE